MTEEVITMLGLIVIHLRHLYMVGGEKIQGSGVGLL